MRTATRVVRLVEVSRLTGFPVRTLRRFEEEGLIERALLDEAELVYGEETVERLLRIRRLREELGVNLAGIEVILRMREEIERLKTGFDELHALAKLKADLSGGRRLLARKVVGARVLTARGRKG